MTSMLSLTAVQEVFTLDLSPEMQLDLARIPRRLPNEFDLPTAGSRQTDQSRLVALVLLRLHGHHQSSPIENCQ